jgi:hypothetical protein
LRQICGFDEITREMPMKDSLFKFELNGDLKLADQEEVTGPEDGSADFTVPKEEGVYIGAERRFGNERRQGGDRRSKIRFEMGKGDRRSGKDRRKGAWERRYSL